MQSPRPRLAALTLVELLVAMAILVTVSASTMLIFRGITRAWRTGALRTERYQQARLLFDLFERELSSAVRNPRYPLIGTGSSDPARVQAGSQFSELFFVGTLPGRTGFVERGYWINAEGNLMCHDGDPADEDYATGASEPCGHHVSQFDVTYFNGVEWVDQWDARPSASNAGQLPQAVHVTMALGQPKPEQFDAIVYVPTS